MFFFLSQRIPTSFPSLLSASNHFRTLPKSFLKATPCMTMPCAVVVASGALEFTTGNMHAIEIFS
ncbi:hypothetical protein BDZ91DRAFT_734763 [Kalaharituber pfeilii]|nr:hypothetical protein BDZ91DRAFT_734763 [Kalaharituber pfeilii]